MEMLSALMTDLSTVDSPQNGQVMQTFDIVFAVVSLGKLLIKHLIWWLF